MSGAVGETGSADGDRYETNRTACPVPDGVSRPDADGVLTGDTTRTGPVPDRGDIREVADDKETVSTVFASCNCMHDVTSLSLLRKPRADLGVVEDVRRLALCAASIPYLFALTVTAFQSRCVSAAKSAFETISVCKKLFSFCRSASSVSNICRARATTAWVCSRSCEQQSATSCLNS